MIQDVVYSALLANEYVLALANGRIYPMRLPREEDIPAVVYSIVSVNPVRTLSGDSGLDLCVLVIRCWASTYTAARSLAAAVRTALNNSSIKISTAGQDEDEDHDTLSFCVKTEYTVWSDDSDSQSYVLPSGRVVSPIREMVQYSFDGDGVTTEFIFPSTYKSDTLLLFKNGVLAENGVDYEELNGLNGVRFFVAPAGGSYVDKFLAYYARL